MKEGRKPFNKKVLIGGGALLSMVAIIAVSSFFPFIIDPSGWQTTEFLTKEIITAAIVIGGVVTTMNISQAKNADDPRSEIAKAKVAFRDTEAKIDRPAFRQWVQAVQQPNDVKTIRRRLMRKHGLEDERVFDLDITEIRQLEVPQKFGDSFYHAMTEDQIRFVLDYKAGKYAIDMVNPDYYLSYSKMDQDLTPSEKGGRETKAKTAVMATTILSKIIRGLIISVIFASLVYDSNQAGEGAQASAWMNFASRMFSLMTSMFSGWLTGTKINDIEADYINLRVGVQKEFLQDKTFQAKTDEELAKEEFKQRVMRETVLIGGPKNDC